MENRGRGRANRGRARGAPQGGDSFPSGPGRPGPPPGVQPQGAWGGRPGGPPPQGPPGAWGSRPQGPPQQQPRVAGWGARPPAPEVPPQSVGRGSRTGGGDDRGVVTGETIRVAQGGDAGDTDKRGAGNGGVRGRTNRNEILNTKPAAFKTKKGQDGTPIKLKANYFPLISATKWGLNQYRVDFNTEAPSDDTRTRKKWVATGIRQFNVTGYLFDGTALYTPNRLHPEPCEFVVADEASGQNVTVQIRLVNEVLWGDWHYLQLFNMIIRKCFAYMQFKLVGRNYYDSNLKVSIPEFNLEVWPGFITSMRQYENQIMLNTDLSFKVLRTDRVYDIMLECGSSRDPKKEFQQRVIGTVVMTAYNNKTYRIDDIDYTLNPDSTFQKRDGTSISYRQYFAERYNVNIRNTNQPLLVSKTKEREIRAGMPELIILVPELCIMTGLSDRQRENFQLMKAMGEHTRINAGDRMRKLLQFAQRLRNCPQAVEEVRRWDLQLADSLVEFQGRVLPPETMLLKNNQPINGGDEANWTRHLRSSPMFITVHIEKLAIVAPDRFAQAAQDFGRMLSKVGQGMSMKINSKVFAIPDDRNQSYLSELEKIITTMNPNMVMVVLPNNSGDRYNAIKKKCYVDRAIPCQVMVGRNLTSKGAMSIATKVAIQMNCKMGGAPWGTSLPKNTMVCGYDVCRDTANKGKSFAGMVASMDTACTKYFSMTVEHEFEQELSSHIAAYMLIACQRFKQANGVYPERIIIYRDGVGDGQIPYVREQEVNLIIDKLKAEIYKTEEVKMAFIIVSKRINTKIFRAQGNQRNDFNPPPGTVVDDVVTLPERYDFYIISQCVNQGTVAPTSYNVIYDTLGIDANRLQRFTFKMCHMYFNWSGTVRVPAPCQYAHKLAFLTAQSLHRSASPALNGTLYYL